GRRPSMAALTDRARERRSAKYCGRLPAVSDLSFHLRGARRMRQPASSGNYIVGHDGSTLTRVLLGIQTGSALEVPVAHRPAATLSNVKGKRDAPSLPANVTCLHSTQTNRSEPTMCVSGMPGAQSCKCSCEVTFSQPKHSFVIMVATPFWNSGEVPGDCA